jgi:integrase
MPLERLRRWREQLREEGAWKTACIAAGFCQPKTEADGRPLLDGRGRPVMVPTVRFHDFRRSAARNLRRAGVGPDVGMKITGHETDSMWRRYSIVTEGDIERALDATQAYVATRTADPSARRPAAISGGRMRARDGALT